jgi:hypothetical protein
VTVAEPAVDADEPSQVAYEALRGCAIAGAASGGLGVGILLREGLAAWLARRCRGADSVEITPHPDRHAGRRLGSEELQIGLVRVLASMVLGTKETEMNA